VTGVTKIVDELMETLKFDRHVLRPADVADPAQSEPSGAPALGPVIETQHHHLTIQEHESHVAEQR